MESNKDVALTAAAQRVTEKESALYAALQLEQAPAYAMPDGPLPMSHFSDDTFELFVGDVLSEVKGSPDWDWYDTVHRFSGGADGGRDVMLHAAGHCTGTVQCKKYISHVDLTMVLVEITKYFLHATFDASLISAGVPHFRWYLAASEGTTGPATIFLSGAGVEHITLYRDQIADAAVKARDKNAYLRNRPELTSLDGSGLCDLIWDRLCTSYFGFLRRAELNRLVQMLPSVKSRYYRLQPIVTGDMSAVMERLNHIAGLLHRKPNDETDARGIVTSYFPHTLLSGDALNIALLPACGQDSLTVLGHLLREKCEDACGSEPVIIVTSANAFTPDQFGDIQELMASTTHPAILVAGCGKVNGRILNEWKEDSTLLFPDEDWKAAGMKQYQAGWCWVRLSDERAWCHVLIENVPADPSCGQGAQHLCLIFRDAHFWPVLGQDYFCGWAPTRGLLRRLFVTVEEQGEKRRHIIALCASDGARSAEVRSAVSNAHNLSTRARICLLMCHSGRANYGPDMRSMCGVFPATDSSCEMLATRTFIPDGAVLRSSTTLLALMTLRWMDESSEIGAVNLFCLKDHRLEDDFPALMTELLNTVNRFSLMMPPGVIARANRELSQQYATDKGMSARLFIHHCLRQLARYSVANPNDIPLHELCIGKLAELNSYLRQHHNVHWQTENQLSGTLKWQAPNSAAMHIIALEDPRKTSRQFQAQIADWMSEPGEHPCLHVLASGWGSIEEGLVDPAVIPRSNLTVVAPPTDPQGRDAAECNASRKASLSALSALDDLFLTNAGINEIDGLLLRMRNMTQ